LRARLQNVQFAGGAVLAPFDIHGTAVVALDDQRLYGQRLGFGIRDREQGGIGRIDVDERRRPAVAAVCRVDHLGGLAAIDAAQNGWTPGVDVWFVDVELV